MTDTDIKVEIDRRALSVLQDCNTQVAAIAQAWRSTDPHLGEKAAQSFTHSLTSALSFGGRISRDGDLSLYVASYIHLGMIFFAKHRRVKLPLDTDAPMHHHAPRRGRYCMATVPASGRYCGSPYEDDGSDTGRQSCECEDPVPASMPILGEWSLHS